MGWALFESPDVSNLLFSVQLLQQNHTCFMLDINVFASNYIFCMNMLNGQRHGLFLLHTWHKLFSSQVWTSVVLINGLFLLSTDVAPGLSLLSTHYLQQQPNYKAFHKDFFLVISITVETVKTLFLYIKLSFYFNNVSSVN